MRCGGCGPRRSGPSWTGSDDESRRLEAHRSFSPPRSVRLNSGGPPRGAPSVAAEADPARSVADGDTIGRNTVSALVVQLTTAGFTAVLLIFLVRTLGPGDYGVLALALGVGSLLFLPSDFGISQSAARFIAERRGEAGQVADVLATAFKLKLLVTGAIAATLFVAAGAIAAAYDEPALSWPLRVVAIALFAQSLMALFQYSFIAVGRTSVGLRLVLSKSVTELGTSLALVLLGAGVVGAAAGRAAGFGLGAVIGLVMAVRLFGRRALSLRGSRREDMRRLASYAGALLIVDGAFAAFNQIDVLLIGAILGTASVGLFEPLLRFSAFLHYPGLSVATGVAPRLARHERRPPNVRAFQQSLRGLIIFQAALIAPVAVWAEPITGILLGSQYAESAEVLRALTPYIFLSGLAPLVSVSVNYLGHARVRIPIAVAALAINATIDVLLLPRIGVVAGSIGTDVAYLLYVPAHFLICKRLLGIRLGPLAVTLARALAAASGMAAVLFLAGTSSLSVFEWAFGAGGGLAVFVAILLASREVSLGEVRTLRRRVAARLGR